MKDLDTELTAAISSLTPEQNETYLNTLVDSAVERYALGCGDGNVENWARDWLSGEDRSMRSAGSFLNKGWTGDECAFDEMDDLSDACSAAQFCYKLTEREALAYREKKKNREKLEILEKIVEGGRH